MQQRPPTKSRNWLTACGILTTIPPEPYVPSAKDMEQYRAFLEKMNHPPFYFDPPKDTQAPSGEKTSQAAMETSQQREQDKDKGMKHLSSNGEKIDALQSLMERAQTDPRARQHIRWALTESQKTEISPAEAEAMHAKAQNRKQLLESTAPSPSSLTFVVGPTHECIVPNPSECLDITGTKVTAWAQPSSYAIPGYELLVDWDLQVTNRCPDTVKDVTFVVDASINCPPGHVYAVYHNSFPSYELTYPANPTVIEVGATASAQNSTLVQCVHLAPGFTYDSAALPDSFILDIHAQGSDTQFTVRSQDKYVAAVGPIPDHCPQTPPPSSSDIPQTPPSPESPAMDTPSIVFIHGYKPGPEANTPIGYTPTKGDGSGFNCTEYWGDAKTFLSERGLGGDLRTIKYYNGDRDCDNEAETRYSYDLHHPLYSSVCNNYPAGYSLSVDGTNDESIYHLSCLFAQYLNYNFGRANREVILVGHSMGGLIIRETLYQMQKNAEQSPFPSTIGHVTKAITFNTPHKGSILGTSGSGKYSKCDGCQQGIELTPYSDLLNELATSGRNPQSAEGFTEWTAIGSQCDIAVLPAESSVGMDASHAVVYSGPAKITPTCYDHEGALHDDNTNHDAKYYYCDTSNPDKYACTNQYLSATWSKTTKGLHGLELLYTRITSSAERSRARLWMAATIASAWALLARQRI